MDVIVVGSGGAALAAAYTAAKSGLRTLVLEKTDYFGGTSAYSGSGIWLPGNQAQHCREGPHLLPVGRGG